jgi:hypothetical protein
MATVARAAVATPTRRNQLCLARTNMGISTRGSPETTDNVLYVYAIPIVIVHATAATRKSRDVID